MIRSMTAYASCQINSFWGRAVWEIRSVNHRYLEISFHLPEQFRNYEVDLYKRIRSCLTRGKIECYLHFDPDINVQGEIILNKKLAKQLIKAANWIKTQSENSKINPVDILRWPGVMEAQKWDTNPMIIDIISKFDYLIDDFILARETEGKALKEIIRQRLDEMNSEMIKVRAHMPKILQWQRERLLLKLRDAGVLAENNRLEQEIALIAQRIDITEELDNLEMHIKETYNILNKKEAIGRRLDFMMQEFNRESNTIASKSINTDITNSAIELKVLIEQMREQIQNVE